MIEKHTGHKAVVQYGPFHKSDITDTWADIEKAGSILAWKPQFSLSEGVAKTVEWTRMNWDWLKYLKV